MILYFDYFWLEAIYFLLFLSLFFVFTLSLYLSLFTFYFLPFITDTYKYLLLPSIL